jgi:hypothetical protein
MNRLEDSFEKSRQAYGSGLKAKHTSQDNALVFNSDVTFLEK